MNQLHSRCSWDCPVPCPQHDTLIAPVEQHFECNGADHLGIPKRSAEHRESIANPGHCVWCFVHMRPDQPCRIAGCAHRGAAAAQRLVPFLEELRQVNDVADERRALAQPSCPECKSVRTHPGAVTAGTWQCIECKAVFQPTATATGLKSVVAFAADPASAAALIDLLHAVSCGATLKLGPNGDGMICGSIESMSTARYATARGTIVEVVAELAQHWKRL